MFDQAFLFMMSSAMLLHTCCGPCASACVPVLTGEGMVPVLYFANSNIDTEEEWTRRLDSVRRLAKVEGVELVAEPYNHVEWLEQVARGFENEPEKGARCARCYLYNLRKTAEYAALHGYPLITTSLTVSPHKPSKAVFGAGEAAVSAVSVEFLPFDFKKRNGFLKSVARTKELGLYRQSYCGCEFSK